MLPLTASVNDNPFIHDSQWFSIKQFHGADLNWLGIIRSMTVTKLCVFLFRTHIPILRLKHSACRPFGPSALHVSPLCNFSRINDQYFICQLVGTEMMADKHSRLLPSISFKFTVKQALTDRIKRRGRLVKHPDRRWLISDSPQHTLPLPARNILSILQNFPSGASIPSPQPVTGFVQPGQMSRFLSLFLCMYIAERHVILHSNISFGEILIYDRKHRFHRTGGVLSQFLFHLSVFPLHIPDTVRLTAW